MIMSNATAVVYKDDTGQKQVTQIRLLGVITDQTISHTFKRLDLKGVQILGYFSTQCPSHVSWKKKLVLQFCIVLTTVHLFGHVFEKRSRQTAESAK